MLKSKLVMALVLSLDFISYPVMAEEITSDLTPSPQESMQNTVDVDASSAPQARKIVKPNRIMMKASVLNAKSGFVFLNDNASKPGVIKL
jgi:hypothetical protein